MTALAPAEVPAFQRKYRFAGAILRRAVVSRRGPKQLAVEFRLLVRQAVKDLGTAPRRVRLTLRLEGVEEFRLQMRPNAPKVQLAEARLAYLNSAFFVDLDPLALEPGDQPRAFDFRASETYAAGRELLWEEEPVER